MTPSLTAFRADHGQIIGALPSGGQSSLGCSLSCDPFHVGLRSKVMTDGIVVIEQFEFRSRGDQ
jgi:hypothetical protein